MSIRSIVSFVWTTFSTSLKNGSPLMSICQSYTTSWEMYDFAIRYLSVTTFAMRMVDLLHKL